MEQSRPTCKMRPSASWHRLGIILSMTLRARKRGQNSLTRTLQASVSYL